MGRRDGGGLAARKRTSKNKRKKKYKYKKQARSATSHGASPSTGSRLPLVSVSLCLFLVFGARKNKKKGLACVQTSACGEKGVCVCACVRACVRADGRGGFPRWAKMEPWRAAAQGPDETIFFFCETKKKRKQRSYVIWHVVVGLVGVRWTAARRAAVLATTSVQPIFFYRFFFILWAIL